MKKTKTDNGILFSAKKKCVYQAMKRHGGKLNAKLLSEISEKAIFYMIPTTWHSGKGKTMETVKRSVVVRGLG